MDPEPPDIPAATPGSQEETGPLPSSSARRLGAFFDDVTAPDIHAEKQRHPEQVGPYRILEPLGEGGMGIVYLAEQREPVRRRVALKLIKLGMDTKEVIGRFEAERQALALMSHPNIARVYEAGATPEGRPYFAMEAIEGIPITEYCDHHKLDIPARLRLFIQVCRGVDHAHHRGVIHRDLKPSNILVTTPDDEPVPKIIDFGLARAINQRLTERTIYTQRGALVGTLAYMSPEQAEMTGEGLDHRTDIYSLGALLYELLVGQTPLEIDVRSIAYDEIVRRIRQDEPVTPSVRWSRLNPERTSTLALRRNTRSISLVHELRGDLDWVCMRALEKERPRRYPTAAHLTADVRRYLEGQPVEARPPSGLYRLRKYVRKNRSFVTATAIVSGALLAGLAGSLSMYFRSEVAREALSESLEQNRRLLDAVQQESLLKDQALARNEAIVSELSEETKAKSEALEQTTNALRRAEGLRLAAHSSLALSDDPGLAVLLGLEAAELLPPSEAPNDVLLAALAGLHERRTLAGHSGAVLWAVFSPGGKTVVSASADKTARIWDAASGKEVLRLEGHTARLNTAAFNRDGTRIVTASDDGTARVWDSATGGEIQVLGNKAGSIFSAIFSPDGARVLTASPRGTTGIWDLSARRLIKSIAKEEDEWLGLGPIVFAAFGPEGRQVVMAADFIFGAQIANVDGTSFVRQSMFILDASSGDTIRTFIDSTESLRTAVFSPDGHFVLTAPVEGAPRLWSTATGSVVVELKGHVGEVYGAAFSPDGRYAITAGHDRTARVWETSSGEEVLRLLGHREAVRSAHFGPDGKQILTASADGTARIWSARHELFRTLTGHAGIVHHAVFSPSGDQVLTASFRDFASAKPRHHFLVPLGDETARVWSLQTGEELSRIGVDERSRALCFSHDGEKILCAHEGGKVSVWGASSREKISARDVFSADEKPLSFSQGGETLLTAPDRMEPSARVWRVSTGELISTLTGHDRIHFGDIGADGRLAVTAGNRTVRIWTTATGEEVVRLGISGVLSAALSPSGDRLVTGCRDGKAQVWKAMTGELVADLVGHDLRIDSVAFSPDGRWIVTASADRTARVWEAVTGRLHVTLRGHTGAVNHAAFSQDGKRVVTASDDRTVRTWPADPLSAARRLKPRDLTSEEIDFYRIGVLEAQGAARGF